MKLLIATKNVHKLREFRGMLKSFIKPHGPWDLFSLIDFPDYTPIQETGSSFEENAQAKAIDAARALQIWTLADDSGLVVPALNGRPGIFSARFAGPKASDKDNRKKLLKEMKGLKGEERAASFVCALALASPQGVERVICGFCEGVIAEEERGGQGFGYDPLFIKHEYSKTFAELEEETKNRISHRRKALDKLLPFLRASADSARALSH